MYFFLYNNNAVFLTCVWSTWTETLTEAIEAIEAIEAKTAKAVEAFKSKTCHHEKKQFQ